MWCGSAFDAASGGGSQQPYRWSSAPVTHGSIFFMWVALFCLTKKCFAVLARSRFHRSFRHLTEVPFLKKKGKCLFSTTKRKKKACFSPRVRVPRRKQRSAWETSHRELSENVSFGIGTFSVG